jgi:hypothetical protein
MTRLLAAAVAVLLLLVGHRETAYDDALIADTTVTPAT